MIHMSFKKSRTIFVQWLLLILLVILIGLCARLLLEPNYKYKAGDLSLSPIEGGSGRDSGQNSEGVTGILDYSNSVELNLSPDGAIEVAGVGIIPMIVEENAKNLRILIYHTHTQEAYDSVLTYGYEETAKWRTDNSKYNVCAVGESLAKELRAYGIVVDHDTTDHEYPNLGTAYSRSADTVKKQTKMHHYDLIIDLHRDAYGNATWNPKSIIINKESIARIMFVVGSGRGTNNQGYDIMPDYYTNLSFANAITVKLNSMQPNFAREVNIKDGRYNQHLAQLCALIEVGHNENSFDEAQKAMPYLANAIYKELS